MGQARLNNLERSLVEALRVSTEVMNGITGIEDRLQDEVSDTIMKMTEAKPKAVSKRFRSCKAGMKVWMLTGDKTAA